MSSTTLAGRDVRWSLLVRVAQWTVIVMTGGIVGGYAAESTGWHWLMVPVGAAVMALAFQAAVAGQRWAVAATTVLWVLAAALGYAHHGVYSLLTLVEAVAEMAVPVALVLSLVEARRVRAGQ